MKRWITVGLFTLGVASGASAQDVSILARFDGAIGASPIANVGLPANADETFSRVVRNVVRGVDPGVPWTIADLKAVVRTDGSISVRGRGLLLASGDSIGRTADRRVFATLTCEAAAPFVELSTDKTGVPLAPNGDFTIDDTVSPGPALECASPLLLIRNSTNGVWFAVAIPNTASARN